MRNAACFQITAGKLVDMMRLTGGGASTSMPLLLTLLARLPVLERPVNHHPTASHIIIVITRCSFLDLRRFVKPAFHDANTDTDILARILADTSDTRDLLKLFLWQAERHADILATILARMSEKMSVSASWNAGLIGQTIANANLAVV